jgi:hypothetical protein
MVKHIITNDALIIPTRKGIMQISKTDDTFSKLLAICNDGASSEDDLISFTNDYTYEDENISLTFFKKTEHGEVFYNGKYYDLDIDFSREIMKLLAKNCDFDLLYLARFLVKVFSNANLSFNELMTSLLHESFVFLSNGNIIIEKSFENENIRFYDKKRTFAKSGEVKKTFAIIDPSTIESDYHFFGYDVIESYLYVNEFKPLKNTWIKNGKLFIQVYSEVLRIIKDEKDVTSKIGRIKKLYGVDVKDFVRDDKNNIIAIDLTYEILYRMEETDLLD